MKIKLNKMEIIDKNDILKRVEYRYSIEDSSGQLKIEQSMYNEIDELKFFLLHLKHLYKFEKDIEYTCLYKNYKYKVFKDQIQSIKMY